jgi:phosphate transport system substrate-binding protein
MLSSRNKRHPSQIQLMKTRSLLAPRSLSLFLAALAISLPPVASKAQASASSTNAAGGSPIRIGGSSTVFPIMNAAIKAYRAAGNRNPIDLRETGTSGGFRAFCQGKLDIANASRPISRSELKECEKRRVVFIELPIAFDALTVVVHPRNTWTKSISLKQLGTLWNRRAQGRIQRWNQVNSSWPDRPIKLCGPGTDSGTYDFFNKAVNGDPTNSRQDYTASEDDTVIAKCVAQHPGALGYFGFSYAVANRNQLRTVPIATASGAITPSRSSVQSGRYPLARPLFLYMNDKSLFARKEVQQFTSFTIRNGLRFVEQAGEIPLPSSTYQLVESKLYKRITGTAFTGDLPVGITIGEVLRRSFDRTRLPQYR